MDVSTMPNNTLEARKHRQIGEDRVTLKCGNQNITFFKGRNYVISSHNSPYLHMASDVLHEIGHTSGLGTYVGELTEVGENCMYFDLIDKNVRNHIKVAEQIRLIEAGNTKISDLAS